MGRFPKVNVRHGEQRSKSFRALAIKAFAAVIAPVWAVTVLNYVYVW